jgi:hypothetical protein
MGIMAAEVQSVTSSPGRIITEFYFLFLHSVLSHPLVHDEAPDEK